MTTSTPDEETNDVRPSHRGTNGRRKLLASGAAVTAAAVAAGITSERSVHAATGDALVLGTPNDAADRTTLDGVFEVRQSRRSAVLASDPLSEDQEGFGGGHGVAGFSEDWAGVIGVSEYATGVAGESANGYGIRASGGLADVVLNYTAKIDFAGYTSFPDGARTAGRSGQMAKAVDGTLWYCVERNTWQRLAGPATSGAFTAIETTRVFDSREIFNVSGLVGGESYPIDHQYGFDDRTGEYVGRIVPALATALTYNITVAQTEGTGFVRLGPNNGRAPRGSVVNWSETGVIIANSGVVALDPTIDPEFTPLIIEIGGTDRTHVVLDVTGYYL